MAVHHSETLPVSTLGAVVDLGTTDDELVDLLDPYLSPPVPTGTTPVPTTYEALSINDLIDFTSHFDPGDLSQGVNVSSRIPEDLSRMVDLLCHREDIPFYTKSDMAREGLYLLCRGLVDKLKIHDPMLLSLMAETRTRAAAKFAVERHAAWVEMRENLEIQLLFWLDRGEPRECGRAIQAFWDSGRQIVHDAWREHVTAVLRDHPLVKASALAALSAGFVFSPELKTFAGDWI